MFDILKSITSNNIYTWFNAHVVLYAKLLSIVWNFPKYICIKIKSLICANSVCSHYLTKSENIYWLYIIAIMIADISRNILNLVCSTLQIFTMAPDDDRDILKI